MIMKLDVRHRFLTGPPVGMGSNPLFPLSFVRKPKVLSEANVHESIR